MSTPLTIPFPEDNSPGVKSSDPFLIRIYDWYQSLIGTSLIGVYKGNWPIRVGDLPGQITKICAVISIRFDPHDISPALSSIITLDPSQRVWKAITGPSDNDPHTDYRLWAESPIPDAIPGQRQTYKIVGVACLANTIQYQSHIYRSGIEVTVEAEETLAQRKEQL